ncbi:MAG TPA: ribosome biogenesis GTP-binding protein YihA/YsxC [Candidatus Syntrophosphaera thermopropionivorans]|jgi:GTP-binding protein|nr:YihA family ribosome biogenesis GTP-binding protein [Candidatus Syntrophosphaera sp.]NLA44459.1 YihA family ribosome biogenesis GTP-binding protein [Candidatus Cloacimonadota bacterium]HNZ44294.1 ribosome biogenesis GTP-binding protein YihA/YsxC [Candidatus Syntrophosphaera thermopropionivorans]HOH82710.1 ribosome biogenesis GTP-binding protein YihA/YsxC [Candidatus Syntrophosphaera thermopropionivorans]HON31957.1 ribosome biogenesis GTP-binding protein YihA/YsxC [Candidatus Syntrophosphaera
MLRFVQSYFVKSAVEPKDYPASAYPEFAVAGRSNVGKSTLINLLTGYHQLAKTSSHPGKTRLLNFFLIRWKDDEAQKEGHLQLTDLPGYGYAEVPLAEQEKWRKMINNYLDQREMLKGIIVLVDIRLAADPKDIQLLEMLKLRGIDYCVVATKADKIPKTKLNRTLQHLAKGLGLKDKDIFPVSALKKTGLEPLYNWIGAHLI